MKTEKRVACERCIKSYKLPKELLGKDKQKCYWCCAIIYDNKIQEKLKHIQYSYKGVKGK